MKGGASFLRRAIELLVVVAFALLSTLRSVSLYQVPNAFVFLTNFEIFVVTIE
jgi:hypothetical protein